MEGIIICLLKLMELLIHMGMNYDNSLNYRASNDVNPSLLKLFDVCLHSYMGRIYALFKFHQEVVFCKSLHGSL